MQKPADTIETTEIEVVAQLAPEEIMATDEAMPELVIVEEPMAEKKDYTETGDLGDFMSWITGKMNSLPPHSGKTTAGCERVIAHLKMLDKEISKAISRDVDCQLDDQAVEKFRKDIRKMVKKLEKRHKEINEAYDADDEKFASANNQIKTALILPGELSKHTTVEGQEANWSCPKCHQEVKPGDEEHIERHKAMCVASDCSCNVKTASEELDKDKVLSLVEEVLTIYLGGGSFDLETFNSMLADIKKAIEDGQITYTDEGENNAADDGPLYCKACGMQLSNRKAAKLHADTKHPGESVTFSSMAPEKTSSRCPTCKIDLWKAGSENLYECISCEAVFERPLTKEAGTARLQLVMTPFERAITGMIVNSFVSQGKNPEETYATLKKKYSFTDRDELSIQQILMDMGYPMLKDRGHIGDAHEELSQGKGIEFSTQYNA